MTHAQAKFYRRMHNSRGAGKPSLIAYIGTSGQPIPGPLSPVELAHKARRSARRPTNLAARRKRLEQDLAHLLNEHKMLTVRANNTNLPEADRSAARHRLRILNIDGEQIQFALTRIANQLDALRTRPSAPAV